MTDIPREFFQALEHGSLEKVQNVLLKNPRLPEMLTDQGITTILLAAYNGQFGIADYLASKLGRLPVFEAAALGDEIQLKMNLVENPTQANALNADGFQPLGLACIFGHTGVARILIEHGADVNAPSRNAQETTPLHSAVASRCLDIAHLLLDHGALVDAIQPGGYTALHTAVQNEQVEMIDLLLEFGADPGRSNDSGITPLDLACKGKNKVIRTRLGIPGE